MSFELFRMTWKRNWLLIFIILAILIMYMSVMITMFDPKDMEALGSMLDMLPADMIKAFGFTNVITDLTSYLASWLYGMLMLAFPLIHNVILGNRLVASMVDNGSFAYLLSTPTSRVKIITTLGLYATFSVVVLFIGIFISGVVLCSIFFPSTLDISAFAALNLTTMLVNLAIMMICFFCSCFFSDAKLSLGFGSGISIVMLLMNMLGNASNTISFLKNFSLYGFYDPVAVVQGSNVVWINLFYGILAIALFISSIILFRRKRLSL